MNVEIGTEAEQFPEKKYINGIFNCSARFFPYVGGFIPGAKLWTLSSYSNIMLSYNTASTCFRPSLTWTPSSPTGASLALGGNNGRDR
jgi:hypothetical protein